MKVSTSLALFSLPLLSLAAPTSVSAPERDISSLSFEDALNAAFSPTVTLKARASSTAETENGLTTDACKALTFVFARGTNEPGNVGDIVGPPLIADLRSSLGTAQVTAQGVTYGASIIGYLEGGDPSGSTEMLRLINLASTKCPSTKIVIGGYSQGAQLVHNAASSLSAAVTAKIVAVVVFGDPDNGSAVGTVPSSKVDSFCHAQDIICTGSGGFTTHLTYGTDAPTAAAFIVAKSGLKAA